MANHAILHPDSWSEALIRRPAYSIIQHKDHLGTRLAEFDVIRNSDRKIMNEFQLTDENGMGIIDEVGNPVTSIKPMSARAAERMVAELPIPAKVKINHKEETMTNQSQKIKWINKGGLLHTRDGQDIKRGETFMARPEDVPMGFRDVVKPLEQLPEERPLEAVKPQYQIVSRGPGTFNVIDGNGKVKNEKPLKQADAKALVESLS